MTATAEGTYTHETVPTRYVQAGEVLFAYRRFGNASAGVPPLVFHQQFTGVMDNWDPRVTDAFARDREVILFDNVGVGSTNGRTPDRVEAMAAAYAAFLDALGLDRVDALGFSLGGIVTQLLAIARPDLVRRAVLVGTGPRGGVGMDAFTPRVSELFSAHYDDPDDMWLPLFFTDSPRSQAAGRAFLDRTQRRTVDRDPRSTPQVAEAQIAAIREWGVQQEGSYEYLKRISQPTLIVNGDDDIIVATINSFIVQQHIPDAQLIIYPDAGHGAWAQYPELFYRHLTLFLEGA